MSLHNHHEVVSGGKSDAKPGFNADSFCEYVKLFFIDNKVIKNIVCEYFEDKLVVHISFGAPCEKFSFQFCVDFKNDITSMKINTTTLQKVVYESPYISPVDASLNDFIFRILNHEVKKRLRGAFAELRVREVLTTDLKKEPQLRVLKFIISFILSDDKTDKKGIDLHLVIMKGIKRVFFSIDIKSYENGLLDIKKDVAGLFVNESMSDQDILHKINTLVDGFIRGEYLRI